MSDSKILKKEKGGWSTQIIYNFVVDPFFILDDQVELLQIRIPFKVSYFLNLILRLKEL